MRKRFAEHRENLRTLQIALKNEEVARQKIAKRARSAAELDSEDLEKARVCGELRKCVACAEVAQHELEKGVDFKSFLREYARIQMEFHRKCLSSWENVALGVENVTYDDKMYDP